MLTAPSIAATVALLLAVGALLRTRSAAQKLARMTESYWELRYETGQLKSRIGRLESGSGLGEPDAVEEAPAPPVKTTFVPLSSLRK